MYLVTVDAKRELVHLEFVGHVDAQEAIRCRAEFTSLLPTLRSGFCLLTDLSALEMMDVACGDEIRAMMDELRQRGVGRIIRVIPDHKKDIGFALMSYFHHSHDVPVQTVKSLAEALKSLQP